MMEQHKPFYQKQIFVCVNEKQLPEDSCGTKGSAEIHKKLKDYVKEHGLKDRIRVSKSLCQDLCSFGPVVSIYPENIVYKRVKLEDIDEIIRRHIDLLM